MSDNNSATSSTNHHGNLREALLDRALEHLREVGPDKISLRALARDIGVSQTAPYRHFTDKTAVLAALAAQGFRHLGQQTRAAIEGISDARDAFLKAGFAYIHFARTNPELYRLMFGPLLAPELDYPELHEAGEATFTLLVELVALGLEQGVFVPGDPLPMANTAWALVHGLASLLIDGRYQCVGVEDLDAQLERSLRLSLHGYMRAPAH
ncbi:MAG: WHG domain-containing protein [Gammaproteobacteria bacterium]|nr:WHG domain-containing protein [Gammaproteobacteria bacterium]